MNKDIKTVFLDKYKYMEVFDVLMNIHKNNFLINMILETYFDFDIIFIQKLL